MVNLDNCEFAFIYFHILSIYPSHKLSHDSAEEAGQELVVVRSPNRVLQGNAIRIRVPVPTTSRNFDMAGLDTGPLQEVSLILRLQYSAELLNGYRRAHIRLGR